ncbi:MAG: bifunctional demethylmenaquinone methyltransferase/2-methoxy-6-polyprenyl-1,4-benzoquinol methylase UbiE [Alphaproteobacteria bacterium]|nr:bifunctional demethylmenaquinone methyltransferase/2-methoxy-6-polyprenyl-1,4-benzoquinol methylase UbiE [Alphaproteobacteria bacterium]
MTDEKPTVSFGFRDVAEEEKSRLVGRVFTNVARRYDVMNDLMSMGIHRVWKQAMIDWLSPAPGTQLLDVAGGTGDISFRFLDRLGTKAGDARATVCDINHEMLSVGRERAREQGYAERVAFACGDAERLPYADETFDAYTIAFGIRNVTHIDKALSEAYRVLKPGGRFLCLEFSKVDNALLSTLYDAWSFNVIPAIGQVVTNDRASYQYLVESIRRFPPQKKFADMIEAARFTQVKWRDLSAGIAAMHSGWKF